MKSKFFLDFFSRIAIPDEASGPPNEPRVGRDPASELRTVNGPQVLDTAD